MLVLLHRYPNKCEGDALRRTHANVFLKSVFERNIGEIVTRFTDQVTSNELHRKLGALSYY